MDYYQCLLHKKTPDGTFLTVAWIPSKYALSDKTLKLQDDQGAWSDGWTVEEVYNLKPEEFVLEHERDFVRQRQASDI